MSGLPPTLSFASLMNGLKAVYAHTKPFVLQIGAMDGITYDLIYPHLHQGGWAGLLVEPIPDMFEKLVNTYDGVPDIRFANCAIAEHNGTVTMHRIPSAAVAEGKFPELALGVSSLYGDRGVMAPQKFSAHFNGASRDSVETITVPCVTLEELIHHHQVTRIDVVMIDAEGADWMITQQFNLAFYRPAIYCLEYTGFDQSVVQTCCGHFFNHGYKLALCAEDGQNLIFLRPDVPLDA